MPGLIAIVGRPNVGKSALFNRIVGRRIAIVHDQPGVTRDRISAEAEWAGHSFTLVDTGGIGLARGEKTDNVIIQAALDQVRLAIESATVILLVVNAREGVVPLDREVAQQLRVSGKPVLVVVNKVDHSGAEGTLPEFAELGFDQIFPVSAIHDRGVETLMEAGLKFLPLEPVIETSAGEQGEEGEPRAKDEPLKIAVVGRPNVGKSSLINALTRSERVIVTPIPGTTRDSVDVPFEVETEGVRQRYILIDTAGVRQERNIDNDVEFYSVKRTEDSIERCDIAVFVLDAEAGVTAHDKKVAGKIVEERKACILVVNKWDLVTEELEVARRKENKEIKSRGAPEKLTTLSEFADWVQRQMFFLDYAPVIFTSAKSGFHLERLLEAIRYVAAQLRQSVPTALLNRTLHDAISRRQPISSVGHHLKFFYATQVRHAPPTFLLFVNRDELFSDPYIRYLGSEIRRAFGFEGCPIVIVAKARPKAELPPEKRRHPSGKNHARRKNSKIENRKSKPTRDRKKASWKRA